MKNKKIRNFIIVIILLVLFTISLILVLKEKHNSILLEIMPEIKYEELDNYLFDNNESIIYIGNNDIDKKFEKELKEYIINNNINIIYMYVNNKSINNLKNDYSINNIYVPNIIIFKDKKIKDILYTNKSNLKLENVISFFKNNEVIK